MSSSEQRDRAEAAFAHLQHAAQEMVAAAHETLDLVEQVVASAQLGEILDKLGHLGQTMFKWPSPSSGPRSPAEPRSEDATTDAGTRRPRHNSPVERISVR